MEFEFFFSIMCVNAYEMPKYFMKVRIYRKRNLFDWIEKRKCLRNTEPTIEPSTPALRIALIDLWFDTFAKVLSIVTSATLCLAENLLFAFEQTLRSQRRVLPIMPITSKQIKTNRIKCKSNQTISNRWIFVWLALCMLRTCSINQKFHYYWSLCWLVHPNR